jgi:hypothetical protein
MVTQVLNGADLDDADLVARIDRLRRVDAAVPAPAGVTGRVRYDLVRHAFPFGTALDARGLGIASTDREGNPRPGLPEEDQRRYQETVERYFHAAVACNEMKRYFMERQSGVAQVVLCPDVAITVPRGILDPKTARFRRHPPHQPDAPSPQTRQPLPAPTRSATFPPSLHPLHSGPRRQNHNC